MPAHPNQGKLIERVNGDKDALKRLIIETINEKHSVNAAAKELGVWPTALTYWCNRLGIEVEVIAREKAS